MGTKIPRQFYLSLLIGFTLFLIVPVLFLGIEIIAWLTGYLLGFFGVVLHLIFSHIVDRKGDDKFLTYFYAGIFIRFLVLITLIIVLLLLTNLDEFSFTVSFIISYIFHSVNEVILLNQKLEN